MIHVYGKCSAGYQQSIPGAQVNKYHVLAHYESVILLIVLFPLIDVSRRL